MSEQTRTTVQVVDFKAMTIAELLAMMADKHMSQVTVMLSEHLHVHVALVFDNKTSAELARHVNKVTTSAIAKANARKKT